MKKKVLILANHYITIFAFRMELVERLLNLGFQVYLSYPQYDGIDELKNLGCEYLPIDVDRRGVNPIKDITLLLKYMKILSKIKPDVVLTYTIKPNIYGSLACRIKKVPCLSNITGLGSVFEKRGIVNKIVVFLYKFALKNCSCIFFQNTQNMEIFNRLGIKGKKAHLLPGSGVNLDKFQVINYEEKESIEFAFVSRVMKEKGIDEYLEAAKYIRNKYKHTRFHICGFCEESYAEKLKKMHDAGIINYHGMMTDVREILKITHCLINPSYHEGMSNVLLEAAACARPGLCSDIPGCREIIDDNESGYLFEAKNSNSLIMAIEKFISLNFEERKRMGVNARKKVEKNFDRNIVIDAYMQEIKEIIGKSSDILLFK